MALIVRQRELLVSFKEFNLEDSLDWQPCCFIFASREVKLAWIMYVCMFYISSIYN